MTTPSDLVSLATVKEWLNITSAGDTRDANLARLITSVSRAVLTKLQRSNILPATYSETRDGRDERLILLRNWPVTTINSVSIDGRAITDFHLEPADDNPPGKPQELTLLRGSFCFGRRNICLSYVAGYQVTDGDVTISGGGSYQVAAPFGDWASDAGVVFTGGSPLQPVASNPGQGQYSVQGGVYTLSSADAGKPVDITYGYIPADLANAALEWISDRYVYQGRIGQKSKSLGGQETVSYIVQDMPAFVSSALQGYMNVVPIF